MVVGCEALLYDYVLCPLHVHMMVNVNPASLDAMMVPKLSNFNSRTMAGERVEGGQEKVMDMVPTRDRTQFLRDGMVLHDGETERLSVNKQLLVANMQLYGTGTDCQWGERDLLNNSKLTNALEQVLNEFKTQTFYDYSEEYMEAIPEALMPKMEENEVLLYTPPTHINPDETEPVPELEGEADEETDEDEREGPAFHKERRAYFDNQVPPPPLGFYGAVHRQKEGIAIVFTYSENRDNTRRMGKPKVMGIFDGELVIANYAEKENWTAKATDMTNELGFDPEQLWERTQIWTEMPYESNKIRGYPELVTVDEWARKYPQVRFVLHADTLELHQHSKCYANQLAILGRIPGHPAFVSVTLTEPNNTLPQAFFMSKMGMHVRIWRPVRMGQNDITTFYPVTFDEQVELEFYVHMCVSEYIEPGLSGENLFGLKTTNTRRKLDAKSEELRKRTEKGMATLALTLELNTLEKMDLWRIENGALTILSEPWQKRFYLSKNQRNLIRTNSNKDLRMVQKDGIRMMRKTFPMVMDTLNFGDWILSVLPSDDRFKTTEIINSLKEGFVSILRFQQSDQNRVNRNVEAAVYKFFAKRRTGTPFATKTSENIPLPMKEWKSQATTHGDKVHRKIADDEYMITRLMMEEQFIQKIPREQCIETSPGDTILFQPDTRKNRWTEGSKEP
jgi:hypothetical protein